MIRIYESDCKDFSKNGLGPLAPSSCTVSETLNGTWELTLEHPLDDAGKWQRLQEERIIVAPVPAAPTPRVGLVHQDNIGHYYKNEIYSINTKRDPLRLRSGPGFDYAIIDHIDIGMEVIVTDTVTDEDGGEWCEVIGPYGEHGFQYKSYLKKERTEEGATSSGSVYATGTVVESRLLRDQPFRIYRVVPSDADSAKVTVYARHLFYDLMDNMIQQYRPVPDEAGATVAESLLAKCLSAHGFRMYSDLTTTASDVDLSNLNPVSAMLEDGGMTANYAAELARDWYDVFMVKRVGYDKDVTIRRGKNLKGITYDADITNVVTRIMPTGEDKNGNVLYLPEVYIASPHESEYVHPKWYRLEVADAAESDATDDDAAVTKEDVYQKLREAAQKEFDNGCDLATLTLTVDFVNCADTEEYKQYRFLQNIYIGDSVRVINSRIGVDTRIRMTDYTFNCLTLQYDAMTLGTLASTPDNILITGKQLGNGIVTGNKIALSSVSTGKLVNGSVVAEKIATHTITVDQIASSVGSNLDISSNRTITLQAQKMEGVFKSIGADGYEKTGIVNIGVNGIGVQHSDIESNTVLDATGMKVYNSAGQVIGGVYAPVANQSAQLVASTMLNPETPEYCAQFKKYAGDHGLTDVYGFELMRTSDGLPLVGLTANADGTEGYLSSRSYAVAISTIAYACYHTHPVVVSASDPGVGNYPEGTLWLKPLGE